MNAALRPRSSISGEEPLLSHRDKSASNYTLPKDFREYQNKPQKAPVPKMTKNQSLSSFRMESESEIVVPSTHRQVRAEEFNTPAFNVPKPISQRTERGSARSIEHDLKDSTQYKKKVDISRGQIKELKEWKDRIFGQIEDYREMQEEIINNAARCQDEFTERFKEVMRQLNNYYQGNINKIKNAEREKLEYLSQKVDEKHKNTQQLLRAIAELEGKIKLDTPRTYLNDFDRKFTEIQGFLSRQFLEKLPPHDFRDFPLPQLEINIQVAHNNTESDCKLTLGDQNFAHEQDRYHHEEVSSHGYESRKNRMPAPEETYSPNKTTHQKPPRHTERERKKEKKRNETERSRSHSEERLRGSLEGNGLFLPPDYETRFALLKGNPNPKYLENFDTMNPKTERTLEYPRKTERDRTYDGEREREKERGNLSARGPEYFEEKYKKKKRHYREKIKALQEDSKEKDKIITMMVESFKELEAKQKTEIIKPIVQTPITPSETSEEAPLRPRNMNVNFVNVEEDTKGSITERERKKSSAAIKKSKKPKLDIEIPVDSDDQTSSGMNNQSKNPPSDLQSDKENYIEPVKRSILKNGKDRRSEESSEVSVKMGRDRDRDDFELESRILKKNSPQIEYFAPKEENIPVEKTARKVNKNIVISPLCVEDEYSDKKEIAEFINLDPSLYKKMKLFIPFGHPPYSNFYHISLTKSCSVKELLDNMLYHLGIEETKHYRYFLTIKLYEESSEKTLLTSNKVWSYLEVPQDKKTRKWPKFYLRTLTDKMGVSQEEKIYR